MQGPPFTFAFGTYFITYEPLSTPDGKFAPRAVITFASNTDVVEHVLDVDGEPLDDRMAAAEVAAEAARQWIMANGHEHGNG